MNRWARWAWTSGTFALAMACSAPPAPSGTNTTPGTSVEDIEPSPPTAETLVGEVDARGTANVAWSRTLPGAEVPPEIVRGPGNELIVLLLAERRPLGPKKYLDDYLLLRLDANTGALRWLKVVEPGVRFAVDTHGNVVLAWPARLQKLDPDGKVLWDKPRQAEDAYERVSVAVDHEDDVLLARLVLDESPGEVGSDPKGFVELEKLDANGDSLWSSHFGDSTSYLEALWLTVDAANDAVLLAAGLEGPFDFGGGALDGEDVVAKYDSNGNHVFSKALGGYGPVGYESSSPIVTDRDGNIFVWTESVGDIDIGLGSFFCGRQYVIKLDPTGKPLWNVCAAAKGIAPTPDGDLLVSDRLPFALEEGTPRCAIGGVPSAFQASLIRYAADGNHTLHPCVTDPAGSSTDATATDQAGMFFVTGTFGKSGLTLPDGNSPRPLEQGVTALVAKVRFPAP